jgi:hypothetical protein
MIGILMEFRRGIFSPSAADDVARGPLVVRRA